MADYSSSSEDGGKDDTTERLEDVGKNFLVSNNGEAGAVDDSSGEDVPSDKNSGDVEGQILPNPFTGNLPSPNLDSRPAGTSHLVFSNPFKEEQTRRESILQQHVKMTEHSKNSNSKKQVCWKFKRGKCRFSKNCKFSHDIDNHIESPLVKNQGSEIPKQFSEQALQNNSASDQFEMVTEDEDDYLKGKRKKRTGMTDSLMPPKKAMVTLSKIQAQERPWTVKR